MAIIRAQVTQQGASLQPEDRYVNVFYFTGDPAGAGLTTLADALENFYDSVPGGSSQALVHWLSGMSGYPGGSVKMYDIADAMPRSPIFSRDWTPAGHAGGSSKNMPDEVALCLSYSAAGASGIPIARRRGRIYIGPFADNAMRTGEGVSAESAPALDLMNCMIHAAAGLKSVAEGAGYTWSVYSPTNGGAAEIINVHVDNAWDIQRRRGNRPSARVAQSV